jgi:polar amino acid transport system substrate-binding protein
MKRAIGGLSALCLFLPGAPVAAQPTLAIAYTAQNEPPYALLTGGELSSGLIHDIGAELAGHLHRRAAFVLLSRNRVETGLLDGTADLYCGLNPAWIEAPERLRWSPPLFTEQDVFVVRPDAPPIAAWSDLRGRRVGTILGYRYAPELEAMFAAGTAIRDDSELVASNFERLKLGWIDAVLTSEIVMQYQQHTDPGLAKFTAAPLVEAANEIYCAAAARPDLPGDEIAAGFAAMIAGGRIEAILASYR